ncbi:MAG: DNA adenine methylase, partial [Bacteroidales bacterium]|nr:DNA adenine methylase [Bacteroidales bacterium]
NQIKWVSDYIRNSEWQFKAWDFNETLSMAKEEDFIYMDPPYIGRNTNYYNSWSDKEALELVKKVSRLNSGFALSMWKENKYRSNNHINEFWKGHDIRIHDHFYHVGSTENLRNKMVEALVIKKGFTAENFLDKSSIFHQKSIFDEN